ncbi:MAG: efflux RND transporter periplasmic adaptor subunit [Chitinophagaceae bacterium]|nr:efflux RND transporter periplasmic adaptor subunit [Chitinophagaceae bacterium]
MNKIYVLATAILLASSCNSNKKEKQKENKYPVVQVLEKDTSFHQQYVADIQANKNVEIHARLSSIIEQIYVDEGQSVKKGQLLFRLNDDELQIALNKANALLNSAKADAKVAEVEMERVKLLVARKIISESELDLAEAKLNAFNAKTEEARAEKAAVQKRLSYTSITSPFEGVIDRLPLKVGSLVAEGSLLTTISDIHSVLVYFFIAENEYFKLMQLKTDTTRKRDVSLILADGSTYAYPGKLMPAESEIDESTGAIAFRADFPNPERLLKHGASGTLLIAQPSVKVLLVPQKSVLEIQDKNFVFLLGKDNVVKMKSFETAQRIDGYYVVKSGLSTNDVIVYEGIQSISDGAKIVPVTKHL